MTSATRFLAVLSPWMALVSAARAEVWDEVWSQEWRKEWRKGWEIRSETVYSSGDFGSNIQTDVLYAPLEIRRKFEWGELGLTVPYLWYDVSGTFTFSGGGTNPQLQTVAVSGTDQGFSDILLDAKYLVMEQSGLKPEVMLRGWWKPPTADQNRGLGTGTHDWILGVEFWSWIPNSERWFYFGDVYRYFAGSSPQRNVRDSWIYDFGFGGLVTDRLVGKVSYKEQTKTLPSLPKARWMEVETEYKVDQDFTLLSGFTVGFSDAAPDWSLMLGFEWSL